MAQSLSSDPYGSRAERYATGSENDANSVEMLAIDNASQRERIREMMLGRVRKQLESQDIPTERRRLIEMKLAEVEWWAESSDYAGWQVRPEQSSALRYEQICQRNINEAVEIFGRDINRYNPHFIDYIRNYALHNKEVPLTIKPQEAIDRIFARDLQKDCLHLKSVREEHFRCAACELLRLRSLLELADDDYREEQRRTNEEIWFLKPFN